MDAKSCESLEIYLLDAPTVGRFHMEVRKLSRAIGLIWSALWPKVRKQQAPKGGGKAPSAQMQIPSGSNLSVGAGCTKSLKMIEWRPGLNGLDYEGAPGRPGGLSNEA